MAYTLEDVLEGVRSSRRFFWKHLSGLTEEQWSWKPYPECKSVTETLAHLILDDRMALFSLETGKEPDYDVNPVTETDREKLISLLHESHAKLIEFIKSKYAEAPLDSEAYAWGTPMKLGRAIAYLSSEDFYHAGQVGYIRGASDPTWDYYSTIYGE